MALPQLHPSVKSGSNYAAWATAGLTILNFATPDLLASLGKWEPVANGVVVILGFVLGSIAKKGTVEAPAPAPDPAPSVDVAAAPAVDPIAVAKAIPAVAAQIAPELVTVGTQPADPAK